MRHLRNLCLALVAFVGVQAFTGPCGCPSDILMASNGYTPLQVPTNLMQPGAIVAISHRRPFSAALVCGPRASLGPNWVPQESPTASQMTSKLNGKNVHLTATLMESIKTDARFSQVSSIVATLNRARVVELRDEDVINGSKNRSPECQASIHARLARGYRITMISSALSGDATYSVRFSSEASLDVKAKVDVMDQLALELGGGATSVSEREIRAVDLIWGIKDDAYLVTLGLPDDVLPTPDEHQRGTGYLGPNDMGRAYILPIPDAPVVMPSHYRPSLDGYDDDSDAGVRTYRQPTLPMPEGSPIFSPYARVPRQLPPTYVRPEPQRGRSQSL